MVQPCVRDYNSRSSAVRALPVELLASILEYLPLFDRFAAARTCHAWRQTSASSNCALSVPATTRGNSCRAIARILPYFGSAPLVFEGLHIGHGNYAVLGKLLLEHMSHIRSLRLDIWLVAQDSTNGSLDREWACLGPALSTAASQLRSLHITCSPYHLLGGLGEAWFGGHAPALERVAIPQDVDELSVPAFRNARTIRMLVSEDVAVPHPDDFPRLQNLIIVWHDDGYDDPGCLSVPAGMRRVWLVPSGRATRMVQRIDYGDIQQLCIDYKLYASYNFAYDVCVLSPSPVVHVDIHAAEWTNKDLHKRRPDRFCLRTYDAGR